MVRGLLMGQHRGRLLAGAHRVADRLLCVLGARRPSEVQGQRSEEALWVSGLERLTDAPVGARAARRGHPVVERLADEGVGEAVALGLGGRFGDEPGLERGVKRVEKAVLVEREHALEQSGIEVATDHRGDAEPLGGLRVQPCQAPRDHILDALRQAEVPEHPRARLIGADAGVGEVADDLLDEERVPLRLHVQRTG